ncbi:MAG: hypothetical protein HZC29_02775 [Thaumarchaeota archaeon]|nr:hypothetical protein [Nitrososphaerota archaeon]
MPASPEIIVLLKQLGTGGFLQIQVFPSQINVGSAPFLQSSLQIIFAGLKLFKPKAPPTALVLVSQLTGGGGTF